MRGGIDEINAAVIKTVSAINTITLPIGLGFAAVAAPATSLVLGPSWGGAEKYVAAFALLAALQIIGSPFNTLLTMRGHTRLQSKAVWFEFGVFLLASAALVPAFFLLGLVWARMLGSTTSLFITLLSVRSQCSLSLRAVVEALMRPLVGAGIMYVVVQVVINYATGDVLKLALGMTCGAVVFAIWSVGSWFAAGKPEGLESTMMEYIKHKFP
jgi:O-antigen/teichoic acid export membrane protein